MKTALLLVLLGACTMRADFYDSVKHNANCTYSIRAYNEDKSGYFTGSAVAYRQEIQDDGTYKIYLITASHVITKPDHTKLFIAYNKIDRYRNYEVDSEIVLLPAKLEIALTGTDAAVLSIISSNKVLTANIDYNYYTSPYNELYILGLPFEKGLQFTKGQSTFSDGLLQATNVPIAYGNSGGGVYDCKTHKLIGITVSVMAPGTGMTPYWNLSFFIPASQLLGQLK